MGLTYTQIGVVALVAGTGMTLFQPLFDYICDRWNPYWLTLLSIGGLDCLWGYLVLPGTTGDYWCYNIRSVTALNN